MSLKTKIWTAFNLIFFFIFGYTLWFFHQASNKLDERQLIENTFLKEKTFTGKVEEITSSQGLKAYFMEQLDTPVVSVSFYFDKAGYIYDKEGLATLVSDVLLNGAGKYNDEAFHDLLELHGISFDFSVSDDTFNCSISFPALYANISADLLNSVLTQPRLENNFIRISKDQMLTALRMQNENPQKVLSKAFKNEFFGSNPKSRDAYGTEESVLSLSREDMKHFIAKRFAKNSLKIAIAGHMTKEEACDFMDLAFGNLTENQEVKEENEILKANYTFEQKHIKRDMPQVITLSVGKGTTRLSDDFYPLYMANEILGGADLTSRLNVVAREKEGLTYGAYTYLDTDIEAPRLIGHFSTSNQKQTQMYQVFLEQWDKMAEGSVTQEELYAVKENMLTSFNLRFTSTETISNMLLYMQKEKLGIDFLQKRNDYVRNVTLQNVNEVARKYFKMRPSFLTIGKENERNDKNVSLE